MEKKLLSFSLLFFLVVTVFGQAKKPTLMVVPSDNYCQEHGYITNFDVQGKVIDYPDYQTALKSDDQLRLVITKIGALMAERGFPLKDLEMELKSLQQAQAEQMVLSSKSTSSGIYESPTDMLKRTANADIILDIDFDVKRQGPKKYIVFNLKGLDSYTSKQVAGVAGSGDPSMAASADLLIEEAALSHMDDFNSQLMMHFDDLFEKGREVTLTIMIWDDAMTDFQEEYDYDGITDELGFLLEDWMADNTFGGRFSTTTATASKMVFDQVRIPLYYERKGQKRAMDTRRFASNLRRLLRDAPFNLESTVYQRGLGEAWLIIGEK